ncbi:hypothetical protein ACP275_11G116300 [Erythranthe tilingii]
MGRTEADGESTENLGEGIRSVGQCEMDTEPIENIGVGNDSDERKKKRKRKEKGKIKDDVESVDQMKMETGSIENVVEGNVIGERKKKGRKNKMANINDEIESADRTVIENIAEGNVSGKRKKKKKAMVNDEILSVEQTKLDTGLLESTAEGEKGKIKDEFGSMEHTVMDTGTIEKLAEGNVISTKKKQRKKTKKPNIIDEIQGMHETNMDTGHVESIVEGEKVKIEDEIQSMDNAKMDTGLTETVAEGNVIAKRKKKRKSTKKAKIKDEIQSADETKMDMGTMESTDEGEKEKIKDEVQSLDEAEMDTGPTETLAEENVITKRKKKPKSTKKANIKDEIRSETKMDMGPMESTDEGEKATINDEIQSMDEAKMDAGPTETLAEGTVIAKRKKKRKSTKKANIKDEIQNVDQNEMDTGPIVSIAEGEKATSKDEIQSMDEAKMDTGVTETLAEGNVITKRKKKPKSTKKAKIKDEIQSVDETEMDTVPVESIVEGEKEKIKDEIQILDETKMDTGPTETLVEENVVGKRKKKQKKIKKTEIKDAIQSVDHIQSSSEAKTEKEVQSTSQAAPLAMPMELEGDSLPCEVSNGFIGNERKGSSEGTSAASACAAVDTDSASFDVEDETCLHLETARITSVRRKLLVLDLNGLLADILMPPPKHRKGDAQISGRAIFTRPYCRDFLEFCFQNFDVGIWSSRAKGIVDKVVNYLLGDLQSKLKFCWDMSRCTQTGLKTLDNKHKPLVCKELRRIWELDNPFLRWKSGDYNESNTLLLDDSPYKALRNPMHTAIFPRPYSHEDRNDNSLGPEGDLRVYLKGLLKYDDVPKYVEQHPFGQRPIDEQHVSWRFYRQVLNRVSK